MCEVALVLGWLTGVGWPCWAYLENKIKFQIRASDMESSLMQEKKLNLYERKKICLDKSREMHISFISQSNSCTQDVLNSCLCA